MNVFLPSFLTRLSADSPFHAELGWEQDRNIKKGKIQFGRCYPGLSEGALNFMKSSLNNKSWWVPLSCCLNTQRIFFKPERVYSDLISGGGPLQPSVYRIPGCVPIEPHSKAATPKCVSQQTSSKITSNKRRRNETRSAPRLRVLSSCNVMLPEFVSLPGKFHFCRNVSCGALFWLSPFSVVRFLKCDAS